MLANIQQYSDYAVSGLRTDLTSISSELINVKATENVTYSDNVSLFVHCLFFLSLFCCFRTE